MNELHGVWRSLVARFVRDEEAVGSNPATPTIEKRWYINEKLVTGVFLFLRWEALEGASGLLQVANPGSYLSELQHALRINHRSSRLKPMR